MMKYYKNFDDVIDRINYLAFKLTSNDCWSVNKSRANGDNNNNSEKVEFVSCSNCFIQL